MPWQIDDVDKFNKGLTETQKKKWVSIANSVLRKCAEGGGKTEECEAKAIRIANSMVNGKQMVAFKANMSDLIRNTVFEGEEHIIAPLVLITEGVHNGVFYSAEELAKFPEAWNGVPIPVYHPEKYGVHVSSNLPDILESRSVGRIFNVRFEDKKLKGEAWINVRKANEVEPRVMEKLLAKEPMEVSTGMFEEEEETTGKWNEEEYQFVAHNIRPDHLALLPDGIGACSWKDGGGLPRINMDLKTLTEVVKESVLGVIKLQWLDSNKKGPIVLLNTIDSENPVQTEKGEQKMDRVEKINALIAEGVWAEEDREFLTGMADAQFDKVASLSVKKDEVVPPAEVVPPVVQETVPEEPVVNEDVPEVVMTLEEFVELAPANIHDELVAGLKLHREKRDALVQAVEKTGVFKKNELESRPTHELEKLAAMAKVSVSYEGRASGVSANQESDTAAPEMPRIEWSK